MKGHTLDLLSTSGRSYLAANANPTCPIVLEARSVLEKVHDLHRTIRRLRRSTQRCLTCPGNQTCPTMSELAQAVDAAIRELWAEWRLDHE